MTPILIVDDMDNYKSHLPQSPVIGKTTGSLFRLPTKVTGCIVWSGKYPQNRKVVFWINHNQFEQSSSKLVSIVYKLLGKVIDDFGSLPKHLSINLDNCWRFWNNQIKYILWLIVIAGRTKTSICFHSWVLWLNWTFSLQYRLTSCLWATPATRYKHFITLFCVSLN